MLLLDLVVRSIQIWRSINIVCVIGWVISLCRYFLLLIRTGPVMNISFRRIPVARILIIWIMRALLFIVSLLMVILRLRRVCLICMVCGN